MNKKIKRKLLNILGVIGIILGLVVLILIIYKLISGW